jgi:type III pantothenate kinase
LDLLLGNVGPNESKVWHRGPGVILKYNRWSAEKQVGNLMIDLMAITSSLIAVDVGNSRIKLGKFDRVTGLSLPEPVDVLDLSIVGRSGRFNATQLDLWCNEHVADGSIWGVASVNRIAEQRLTVAVTDWVGRSRFRCPIRRVTYADVPLVIRVDEPKRVGIDRLLAAFATEMIRQRDRPAIIVDLGTAITVDLVEADSAFAGGAILPGIAMSAASLAEHTDALPHVAVERLERPPLVPGKSTTTAIEAGVYWGAVGAIRELVSQLSFGLTVAPELFFTGGASTRVAEALNASGDWPVRHVPHLVLAGIALVHSRTVDSAEG